MAASLRNDLNNAVVNHLQHVLVTMMPGATLNVPVLVSDLTACIADMVFEQPESERHWLIAHAHIELDRWVKQKWHN